MLLRPTQHAFTLVELIIVIVLLGIISAVLVPVITSNITAYSDTRSRNELIALGRLSLERLSREIQAAIPNSLRVVTPGIIEFVTASDGGRYVDRNDTLISAASCPTARRFAAGFNLTQLCLLNPTTSPASNDILVIGNTSPSTLQAGNSRVDIQGVTGASPLWTVSFAAHNFNDASPGKHFSIVDSTNEVGLVSGALRWRRATGIDTTLYDNAVDVSSSDVQLIGGVGGVTFRYNAIADGMLNVELTLSDGSETVQLYEEIYVRNTP